MKRVRGAVSSGINYVEEDRLQAEKRLEEKRVAKRIEAEKKSEERRAEAAKKLEAKRVAAEKKLEEKKIAAEKKSKEEEGRHADQQRELKDIYDFFRKRGRIFRRSSSKSIRR